MFVRDVMVAPVVTVEPSATVQEVAKLFLDKRISAVPVLDLRGKLVGIVSEGDLMRRAEVDTERRRSAIRVAAESTPGVCAVNDNLATRPMSGWF